MQIKHRDTEAQRIIISFLKIQRELKTLCLCASVFNNKSVPLCLIKTVLLQEPAVAEQGLGVGLLATEVDIHVHGVVDAARSENIGAEAIGHVLVEE